MAIRKGTPCSSAGARLMDPFTTRWRLRANTAKKSVLSICDIFTPCRTASRKSSRNSSASSRWKDRKSTRLNSSHSQISYAVFCLKKKKDIRCLILGYDLHILGDGVFPELVDAMMVCLDQEEDCFVLDLPHRGIDLPYHHSIDVRV